MRPLKFSINVTLDGCIDHRVMIADEALHQNATANIERADALILGRVTYELMEAAWRRENWAEPMPDWMLPFAETMDAARKYVVSNTLENVDWNAEILEGDLGEAVKALKQQPGDCLFVGGAKLAGSLAELDLIDEYEFVVHPRVVGQGPSLFSGLSKRVDLKLVDRAEFSSGAVALRYVPVR